MVVGTGDVVASTLRHEDAHGNRSVSVCGGWARGGGMGHVVKEVEGSAHCVRRTVLFFYFPGEDFSSFHHLYQFGPVQGLSATTNS